MSIDTILHIERNTKKLLDAQYRVFHAVEKFEANNTAEFTIKQILSKLPDFYEARHVDYILTTLALDGLIGKIDRRPSGDGWVYRFDPLIPEANS